MELVANSYMPGDPRLVEQLVYELKSQGIFDQFRKECIADVDTKPAYQNLRQRVEGSVTSFLKQQTWRPDMNKNHVREQLRKNIYESGYLDTGVERIVDQVVNPKINTIFLPQVEDVVYRYLGIEKPNRLEIKKELKIDVTDLLPTDLEAISPESDHTKDDSLNFNDSSISNAKMEEDESPPFEPIDVQGGGVQLDENSVDSHLSGFSGLQSHDSNPCTESKECPMELSNQDSQASQNSSDSRLSIITSEDNTKMEIREDSESKLLKSSESNSLMENPVKTDASFEANSIINDEQMKPAEETDSNSENNVFEDKNGRKQDEEKDADVTTKKQNDDKKSSERKTDEKKSRSSEKFSSKDKKDDKYRKSSSSSSREKDKSGSKYSSSSSSKDRSRSKDKKESRSSSSSGKDKDKVEKEKYDKDKPKNDKDRSEKEKDKDKRDKYEKDKSEKSKTVKEKEKSTKDKDKARSSSSNDNSNGKSNSNKEKDKSSSSSKSDSSRKDKEKSRLPSSSSNKSKSSHSDSKSSKSSSDKYKKDDKTSVRHSSSSKDKNKKKDSKKDVKDDHYSSKDKKNDRRSTDRDSNDGRSGRQSQTNSISEGTASQPQKSGQDSSNSNSGSGSGDSGASDQNEHVIKSPVKMVAPTENKEVVNACLDTQRFKYLKPKFASNFQEARKLMKIRKQLAKLERHNQLSLAQIEIPMETPMVNGTTCAEETDVEVNSFAKRDEDQPEESAASKVAEEVKDVEPPPREDPVVLQSTELSKESWEALEARLAQEMSNINYNSYESPYDDYDYSGCNSTLTPSPKKLSLNAKEKPGKVERPEEVTESVVSKPKGKLEKIVCIVLPQMDIRTKLEEKKENAEKTEEKVLCNAEESTDDKKSTEVEEFKMQQELKEGDKNTNKMEIVESLKIDTKKNVDGDEKIENLENKHHRDSETTEPCTYLEPLSPRLEKNLQFLYRYIERLEQDVKHSLKTFQNNFVPLKEKYGKRKLVENVDLKNNNKAHYEQTADLKKKRRSVAANQNSVVLKTDKEKLCNSSDISSNDFSLPLSPAESDKSSEKKDEDSPKMKLKRETGRGINTRNQRYSSEDLYKPRPVFMSSRRSRVAKNVGK